jgi:small subunit ribosomal protein S18
MPEREVVYQQEQKKRRFNMAKTNEIKYLTAIKTQQRAKKFCRFKKYHIRYVDYKDGEFLKKFLNEQGKMLPRRITGNSLKYQRKVADAIKKARQMAILPYVTDLFK